MLSVPVCSCEETHSHRSESSKLTVVESFCVIALKMDTLENNCVRTASIIYTRDADGTFLFAFARKVSDNMRVRPQHLSSGSAGTDKKFWGRWTSFGGTKNDKDASDLSQALEEIQDEGDIVNSVTGQLQLESAQLIGKPGNCTTLLIFHFPDVPAFLQWFPKYPRLRSSASIVAKSKGEIDAVSSFSTGAIMSNVDAFASYVIKSFNAHVIPFVSTKSSQFETNWGSSPIQVPQDGSRNPRHERHRYYELCKSETDPCPFKDILYTRERPTGLRLYEYCKNGEESPCTSKTYRNERPTRRS